MSQSWEISVSKSISVSEIGGSESFLRSRSTRSFISSLLRKPIKGPLPWKISEADKSAVRDSDFSNRPENLSNSIRNLCGLQMWRKRAALRSSDAFNPDTAVIKKFMSPVCTCASKPEIASDRVAKTSASALAGSSSPKHSYPTWIYSLGRKTSSYCLRNTFPA